MKAPIETKVIAAASGAGLGGAAGTFILWLLGFLCWGASPAADKATSAVAAVPQPVAALIVIVVGSLGAAIGGYEAPHTSRPDLKILGKALVGDGSLTVAGSTPVEATVTTSNDAAPAASAEGGAA